VPLLGQVPLEPAVSTGGDAGEPVVLGSGAAADAFRAIAGRLLTDAIPPAEMAGCSARMLDAAVAALTSWRPPAQAADQALSRFVPLARPVLLELDEVGPDGASGPSG
jgi:ATP-binding protein involved in chromosome partitioning